MSERNIINVTSREAISVLAISFAVLLIPESSFAAAGDTIGQVLCEVIGWFNGSVGKGIASLAIIIIGIGALMGKVSWGMAITVGIGVAVLFGASDLVKELTGTDVACPTAPTSCPPVCNP